MEAISQGPGRIVFMVSIGVLLVLALYRLYMWLYGSSDLVDTVLYQDITSGMIANGSAAKTFSVGLKDSPDVPALYGGGEYTISTWVYITNWSGNMSKNKLFLTLSGGGPADGGYQTLAMFLGQATNKLGVRVSNSQTMLSSQEMNKLVNGQGDYTDANLKPCDVDSVDLQRWVCITVCLNGRTVDLYVDGKLSRSCVYPSIFMVDADTPTLKLGGPDGFNGYIGKTRAANFAYSPDLVYKTYLDGPFDTSLLSRFLSNFSVNVTVGASIK